MSQLDKSREKKRTLSDIFISLMRALYYRTTETARLSAARFQYEKLYNSKNTNPLVTILMPTYNRGKLLVERTLPSILNQTYSNFEVVIVGDGPTDNTRELISSVHDKRIHYFEIPHYAKYPLDAKSRWFVGGVPPRNFGLAMARGLWIAELDDDDIFLPDHVESLLHFAEEGNYELTSAAYIRRKYGKQEIVDARGENPRVGGIETWFYRSYLRMFTYNIDSWRKNYNCPQEIDRQMRMYNAGVRMGFLDKVVTSVLPIPGSETVGLDALEIIVGKKLR